MASPSILEVNGTSLRVTNLDKILYPSGFSKAEVLDYYAKISPVMLAHLAQRPASFQRFPDGVQSTGFFAKNAPRGTPDWVRRATLPAPGSNKGRETIDYVVVDDLQTLLWVANLAGIEIHVPQWRVAPGGEANGPDLLVLDLDPGPPADVITCAEVALLLREVLDSAGLKAWAKTSGSKGMQLYLPVGETVVGRTSEYAKELAVRLEKARPDLVVSRMTKSLRSGKVLVDWSQNNPAKTTVAAYSLRARPRPTVSTPVTWDEVEQARSADDLRFEAGEVLERVAGQGDLMASMLTCAQRLP